MEGRLGGVLWSRRGVRVIRVVLVRIENVRRIRMYRGVNLSRRAKIRDPKIKIKQRKNRRVRSAKIVDYILFSIFSIVKLLGKINS